VTEDQANNGVFDTSVVPATGQVDVGTAGGAVTFTNTKRGALTIKKVQIGGLSTQTFTIGYDCGPGFTGSVTLLGNRETTISNLPAGSVCSVSESASGYSVDVSPKSVKIEPGVTSLIMVTNTRLTTSLTINKEQVGGTAAERWTFDVNCGPAPGETFQVLNVAVEGSGTRIVSGIPTGLLCTVTEDQANNGVFDTSVVPATGQVDVGTAGGAVTFTNTKRARLTVTKTQNGGVPTFQYTFSLTGGPDNVNISRTTLVDPSPLDFGLVKPGTYTLCELAVAAGTSSSLETLPGATTDGMGTVCAQITLVAGVDLNLAVDNQLRTGGQRTIGYWKNWSTCGSTAGQLANAARTGKTLLDQVLPLNLGPYLVDTCAKGLAVLSNPSGKYAENQLAAQLLAAKANVAVGAACGSINATIASADGLLASIGYAGSKSSKVGGSHPQRPVFTSTAATLDQFNNGKLC
jgi:hypothetical protein